MLWNFWCPGGVAGVPKVPTYSTRAGAAPRAPGGARHGGGNRAVNSQPHMGQSTLYGDVKSSYGGAGGWDRRGSSGMGAFWGLACVLCVYAYTKYASPSVYADIRSMYRYTLHTCLNPPIKIPVGVLSERNVWGPQREGGVWHVAIDLLFSSAAGGAYWPIAIGCPSLPFP